MDEISVQEDQTVNKIADKFDKSEVLCFELRSTIYHIAINTVSILGFF